SWRTMPAHAVPWPQRSPSLSGSTYASPSSPIVTATARSTSPTSSWAGSTPLSRMQTRTPAPVESAIAQSRVTRSGHSAGSRIRSPASAGRLHAGIGSGSGARAASLTPPILEGGRLEEFLQLHRRAHVALDLELSGHVRGGRVLLALRELLERLGRRGDR